MQPLVYLVWTGAVLSQANGNDYVCFTTVVLIIYTTVTWLSEQVDVVPQV